MTPVGAVDDIDAKTPLQQQHGPGRDRPRALRADQAAFASTPRPSQSSIALVAHLFVGGPIVTVISAAALDIALLPQQLRSSVAAGRQLQCIQGSA